ncbi:MAG: HD domain-containing phosphohydrolase [Victivallales bacterium]
MTERYFHNVFWSSTTFSAFGPVLAAGLGPVEVLVRVVDDVHQILFNRISDEAGGRPDADSDFKPHGRFSLFLDVLPQPLAEYPYTGKILIPSGILGKSEPLSKKEYAIIRKHPELSLQIISSLPEFEDISHIMLHHHECWDGTGYPHGLKGEKICVDARICCLADSFDAMRTDRPYSSRKPLDMVLKEIGRCTGQRFDSSVVESFNRCYFILDKIAQGK